MVALKYSSKVDCSSMIIYPVMVMLLKDYVSHPSRTYLRHGNMFCSIFSLYPTVRCRLAVITLKRFFFSFRHCLTRAACGPPLSDAPLSAYFPSPSSDIPPYTINNNIDVTDLLWSLLQRSFVLLGTPKHRLLTVVQFPVPPNNYLTHSTLPGPVRALNYESYSG